MTPLERMIANARAPHRATFRSAMLAAIVAAAAGVALLALSGWFIAAAAVAGAAGLMAAQGFNYLIPSAGIRLLAIGRTAARYGERLLGHQAALRTLASVRVLLFSHLIRTDLAASSRSAGDIAAHLIEDVTALEERLVRGPTRMGAAAGLAVAVGCTGFAGWPAMLAAALATAAGLALAWPLTGHRLAEAGEAVQRGAATLKRALVSQVAASADIAAYALTGRVSDHVLGLAKELDGARLRLARREASVDVLGLATGAAGIIAILLLSTASLPLTLLAVLAQVGAGEMAGVLIRTMARDALAKVALSRLATLTMEERTEERMEAPTAPARIAFRNGMQSIVLSSGDRLAITGRSGSGKTRLLETLAGWRDDAGRALWIDGVPVDPGQAPARRPAFALAPQDAQMIAGTIADNLRLARAGVDETAMWEALACACLADDVRAMPRGLLTWVGDSGMRLSGGQRKRLSIARALLARRPWLLLDEPSEGLDAATEAQLCRSLDRWLSEHGAGLLLVTHRPAMMALAPRRVEMP